VPSAHGQRSQGGSCEMSLPYASHCHAHMHTITHSWQPNATASSTLPNIHKRQQRHHALRSAQHAHVHVCLTTGQHPPPHSGLTTLTSPQLHAQGSLLVLGCKTLRVHRFTPLQHHQPPCLQILSVNQLQPVLERCERGYRGSTPPGGPAKSGPVTVATLGR
jgi:hypothetical protein